MTAVAYIVYITDRAAKEFSKNVAHQDKERVKAKIRELGADPRPHGCRKVRV